MKNTHIWEEMFKDQGYALVGISSWNAEKLIAQAQHYISLLTPHIPEDKKIVDFGCGIGRLTRFLEGFSAGYIGIDHCKPLLELAQVTHPQSTYYHLKELPLPLAKESTDIIITTCVLQHITDEKELKGVLSEFSRILRSDGKCIIYENTSTIPSLNEKKTKFRSIKEYKALFEEAGLKLKGHVNDDKYKPEIHTLMEVTK